MLQRCFKVVAAFLCLQVANGAQMLMLFESHAGELGVRKFREFSGQYLHRIAALVKAAHPDVPIGVFAKGLAGGTRSLRELAESKFDVIQLDWKTSVAEARQALPGKCLQGNLDPASLYAGSVCLTGEVQAMMKEFQGLSSLSRSSIYPLTIDSLTIHLRFTYDSLTIHLRFTYTIYMYRLTFFRAF